MRTCLCVLDDLFKISHLLDIRAKGFILVTTENIVSQWILILKILIDKNFFHCCVSSEFLPICLNEIKNPLCVNLRNFVK